MYILPIYPISAGIGGVGCQDARTVESILQATGGSATESLVRVRGGHRGCGQRKKERKKKKNPNRKHILEG
jgi:hypothetical protein